MTTAAGYVPVSSEAELRDLLGEPSPHAAIVKSVQDTPETLEELRRYYGPEYADRLY